MPARILRIHGKVQGVYFRAWAIEQATALGLKGWVRNRKDGTVETLLIGPEETLDEMITICRVGPPAAIVDHIDISEAPHENLLGFEQRPTE